MVTEKYCRDCGEARPVGEFTRDRSRPDGLSFYCKVHARRRLLSSKDARQGPPKSRHKRAVEVPHGHKWCPDCALVKPVQDFVRNASLPSGRAPYCKPCHNIRGKASKEKVGGSRTYHLKRRYGITAEEADEMLAEQGGLCAVCRTEPAAHVDHDHDTGSVRELLCFNCNGGLGQFKDDLSCSVQPPTTSSDIGPRGGPSAAARGPKRLPGSIGLAFRVTGAAAPGSPAGRRCAWAPERRSVASSEFLCPGDALSALAPDSHGSGSPVGSRATAPETPARGREADG